MKEELAVIDYSINFYKNYCASSAIGFQNYRDLVHAPGFTGCLVHDDLKTIFMHIDKCASRSITSALRDLNFRLISEDKSFIINDEYKIFAVVRDPVTRWPAGLNEYMYRYLGPECDEENPMYGKTVPKEMILTLEEIEQQVMNEKIIFEEHTAPQHLFLKPCENKQIHYVRMDDKLEEKLQEFLQVKIELPNFNVSEDKKPNYKKFCKEMFDKHVRESSAFRVVYEKDFEIFEKSE